jgi:translation elongation factor EF-Tu-like GTPase
VRAYVTLLRYGGRTAPIEDGYEAMFRFQDGARSAVLRFAEGRAVFPGDSVAVDLEPLVPGVGWPLESTVWLVEGNRRVGVAMVRRDG